MKAFQTEKGGMQLSESIALKVVSVVLALILWITILGFKREEIRINVPLEPLLPPGMMITSNNSGTSQKFIQFTLSGPRVSLKNVEKHIGSIRPDFRKTHESMIGFPVGEEMIGNIPAGVRVIGFNPTHVIFRLEEVMQKSVSVKPLIVGRPAAGFEVASIRVDPGKVTVLGPKSTLSSLDSVSTREVDLSEHSASFEQNVELEEDQEEGIQFTDTKEVMIRVKLKPSR